MMMMKRITNKYGFGRRTKMPNTSSGKTLIKDLGQILTTYGYTGNLIAGRNLPALTFIDIMGQKKCFDSEFLLQWNGRDVRVHARHLGDTGGTVIEKLPYLLENAHRLYTQNEVIFILEGNGYDKGNHGNSPRRFMQTAVNGITNKRIVVWTKDDFESWVKAGMPLVK
jgi:hypothetical protein